MTLLQALRALGHEAPRWVSPSGRLVFSDPGREAQPVKPHTFHGGKDVAEDANAAVPRWWQTDAEQTRDKAAMAEAFPSFTRLDNPERPPAWHGTIDTGYGRFDILIQHRLDHGLPYVVPISPSKRQREQGRRIARAPHLFDSGALCVADQSDWDSEEDTTATVVAWAAHWHACYVSWFSNGQWPTSALRPSAQLESRAGN